MTSIAVVDDNPLTLTLMRRTLERAGLENIRTYSDPQYALSEIASDIPSVLLLDYLMPGIDGLAFLHALRLKGVSEQMPVALMSSATHLDSVRIDAYRAGAIEVLCKPIDPQELGLRIKNLSRIAPAWLSQISVPEWNTQFGGLICSQDSQAISMILHAGLSPGEFDVLRLLAGVITNSKLSYMVKYAIQTARYAAAIAQAYGLDAQAQGRLILAAPFYDIGKLALPEKILHKKTALIGDEITLMQKHTIFGHDLLSRVGSPIMDAAASIALYHHERWDGKGYPQGIQGSSIPLFARIVSIAETFEIHTRHRLFTRQSLEEELEDVIFAQSGKRFDPAIVRSLKIAQDDLLLVKAYFDELENQSCASSSQHSIRLH